MSDSHGSNKTHRQLTEQLEELAGMALGVAADAMQQWSYERDHAVDKNEAAMYDGLAHDAEKLSNAAWEVLHAK